MKLKRFTPLILIVCLTIINAQTYKNAQADIEERIQDLLSRMTLAEKIGQLQQYSLRKQFSSGKLPDKLAQQIRDGKVGSFLNAGTIADRETIQKIAVNETRLGIPIIFGRDVIHGYRTILPIPLGQAATWNYDLLKKGSAMAAREAAEDGYHWTFAPMIDISRDTRWGRIAESCGEDPYMTSQFAKAMVEGFQGDDLSAPHTIASCAKHYIGYGATEGGRDYNTTLIPERELRDVYLKPFKTAVDAGAATLMSAFNDLNGVPTSGNKFTLKTILRDEWNFDGFVVSDWKSITDMMKHGYTKDGKEAALKAFNAGVNMEMVSKHYQNNLEQLLKEGKVKSEWLDEMVAGILRIKFKLGLFETPYRRYSKSEKTFSDEYKELAKESTIESAVLLKNDNNLLPLSESIKSLAVIGPMSDDPVEQLGTWNKEGRKEETVTPLAALRKLYKNKIKINYAPGLTSTRSTETAHFAKAVEAAKNSDAVVLFLGEDHLLSGETHCRAFINLPGAQEKLIKEIHKTGKPVIVVVLAGRALTFGNIIDKINSLVFFWHPGTMGGPAIADLLFGKVSPSGKLPVTFPRTVGQIPLYYNHKNTGKPPVKNQLGIKLGTPENPVGYASYYLDVDFTPAYYFGYGMSYTTFKYSDLKLSSNSITKTDKLTVSVKVKNTGNYKAKETVQLYIRDLFGSVTRPVKELKGFEKISLKPGETKVVSFTLSEEDLKFWDIDMKYVSESGDFEIFVGSSSRSEDLLKSAFQLK